jgi:gas vesicle protein
MTDLEDQTKKLSNTIKDETDKSFYHQDQQINNTITNVSESKNRFNENINEKQTTNKEIFKKSIDATNKYQQDAFKTVQSITYNFVELQKNLLDTYQSVISRFLEDVTKSYSNTNSPNRYADIYTQTNQTITDNTTNATHRINDMVIGSTETFNKSIEIAQKYYNDSIQNFFNFLKKIERSSNQ